MIRFTKWNMRWQWPQCIWFCSLQRPLFAKYFFLHSWSILIKSCVGKLGHPSLFFSIQAYQSPCLRTRKCIQSLSGIQASGSISQYMFLVILNLSQDCPSRHQCRAEREVRSQQKTEQEILSVPPSGRVNPCSLGPRPLACLHSCQYHSLRSSTVLAVKMLSLRIIR